MTKNEIKINMDLMVHEFRIIWHQKNKVS